MREVEFEGPQLVSVNRRPGNREKAIIDTGWLGAFAQLLRDRRAAAEVSYRVMERLAHFSFGSLAEAARGVVMPSWELTRGYLIGCGVAADGAEMQSWQRLWADTQSALGGQLRALGLAAPVVQVGTAGRAGRPGRSGRLRPMEPSLVKDAEWRPRPEKVRTYAELRLELIRLKIAAGDPSLREIHWKCKSAGPEMTSGQVGAWPYSVTTLGEVLSGKREPRDRNPFTNLVAVLLQDIAAEYGLGEEDQPWRAIATWRDAWNRAETNRQQPHLLPVRKIGNVVLLSDAETTGPAAEIIAGLNPEHAAALLAQMPLADAIAIVQQLPGDKAQQVLILMHRLHNTASTGAEATGVTTPQAGKESGISVGTPPPATANTGTGEAVGEHPGDGAPGQAEVRRSGMHIVRGPDASTS